MTKKSLQNPVNKSYFHLIFHFFSSSFYRVHCYCHRIILVCVFYPLCFSLRPICLFPSPYFPSVVFSFRCVCSLWSFFRYIVFYLSVFFKFVVFVHCGRHRIILVCVFHPLCFSLRCICLLRSSSYHPYMFSIICVFLSLCLFIVIIIQI
jgi:hypothetical protein